MTKEHKHDGECGDECGDDCGCGSAEMSVAQVVQNNNLMINVMADILIEKKIINEKDIQKKLEAIYGAAQAQKK